MQNNLLFDMEYLRVEDFLAISIKQTALSTELFRKSFINACICMVYHIWLLILIIFCRKDQVLKSASLSEQYICQILDWEGRTNIIDQRDHLISHLWDFFLWGYVKDIVEWLKPSQGKDLWAVVSVSFDMIFATGRELCSCVVFLEKNLFTLIFKLSYVQSSSKIWWSG